MKAHQLPEADVRSLFRLAGFEVLSLRALVDGYGYPVADPRFTETPPRCNWWFVKTQFGWIDIGWRKRVIEIFWEDCGGPIDVTADDVTKNGLLVHAWSVAKVIEYLTALRAGLEKRQETRR